MERSGSVRKSEGKDKRDEKKQEKREEKKQEKQEKEKKQQEKMEAKRTESIKKLEGLKRQESVEACKVRKMIVYKVSRFYESIFDYNLN